MKLSCGSVSHLTTRLGAAALAVVLLGLSAAPAYARGGGRQYRAGHGSNRVIVTPSYNRVPPRTRFVTSARPLTHVHRVPDAFGRTSFVTHNGPMRSGCAPQATFARSYQQAPAYSYGGLGFSDPNYGPRYRGRHSAGREVANIAIGSGVGALVGGLVGGKKGAVIGAAAGGAGTAILTHRSRRSRYSTPYPGYGIPRY